MSAGIGRPAAAEARTGDGRGPAARPETVPPVPRDGVPELLRGLLRAVLLVGKSTARLAGIEAREVFTRLGRRMALLVAAAIVAGAGVVLVLAAFAFVAEGELSLPRWAAFALVGTVALALGGCGVAWAVRRLGAPDLAFPGTIAELSKDVEALASRGVEP